MTIRICEHCQGPCPAHQRKTKRFCGRKCASLAGRVARVTACCPQCGRPNERAPHTVKSKQGHAFCNLSCSALYSNAHKTTGTRRSKLEVWLEERLRETYPDLDLLCNDRKAANAELDFFFPSLRLAFELNGIFHYEPIFGPEKLARTQTNDARKFQACLERGIELCVIDTERFTYFKTKGAEKFLTLVCGVVDRVIRVRVAEGVDIRSMDPLRGRTIPPEPEVLKALPFRVATALEDGMRWYELWQASGLSQRAFATQHGVWQPQIALWMRMLKLPEPLKEKLLARDPSVGTLSIADAIRLLREKE